MDLKGLYMTKGKLNQTGWKVRPIEEIVRWKSMISSYTTQLLQKNCTKLACAGMKFPNTEEGGTSIGMVGVCSIRMKKSWGHEY